MIPVLRLQKKTKSRQTECSGLPSPRVAAMSASGIIDILGDHVATQTEARQMLRLGGTDP
jgi:hypothetical protein